MKINDFWIGYLSGWRHGFDFSGRAYRHEFWMFMAVHFVISLLLIILDVVVLSGGYLDLFYSIISLFPMLAFIVRRLHDAGHSGWWGWVFLLPIIGPFWLIYLLCKHSEGAMIEGNYSC